MFEVGGINLNASVSEFLRATHPVVPIQVVLYKGRINNKGKIEQTYHDPINMEVQMQVPNNRELQHINFKNDNTSKRAFWISSPVYPIDRNLKEGADRIIYDGHTYEITWVEDFSVTGWVQVIGEEIIDGQ